MIRKNARAISAYGRMSGAAVVPASEFSAVSAPAEDPFGDVGAIFDDLQGRQREPEAPVYSAPVYSAPAYSAPEPEPVAEPAPVIEQPKPARRQRSAAQPQQSRDIPDKVTEENAPSGIWTEERNLFPEPDPEELEMLKEKKRTRSAKTQRLFDAIMREPEDNPNVRRKK